MTTQLYATGSSAVTVRNPDADGFQQRVATAGANWRALDGTLRQHYVATRYTWTVRWSGLTQAEHTTLLAELGRSVVMTFKPPDASATYQVLRIGDVQTTSDGFSWGLTATLEQI